MKTKKKKYHRPWLSPTGVEIPLTELKEIAKSWNPAQWEEYLSWFETGCKEVLVHPAAYAIIGDEQTESIFEQFDQDSSPEKRAACERLLALLPEIESCILRLYFLEGRTEAEIGFILSRSQTGICLIKNRALSRLKRGNDGDEMFARHFMKGDISSYEEEPRLWDESLEHPLKEARFYDPKNHRTEFEQIKMSSIRVALLALPDLEQRILYLRYWCDFSVNRTARELGIGLNTVLEIETAAITKTKRNAVAFETGVSPGGASCA
jgi:DNA-directed RNA polymerase specialized sigma subunit